MTKALFSTQHLLSDLPEKIGKYPVVGTAGRGNMGIVYIGYDPFHNRDVAIKVCNLSPGMEDETARVARKMFFNEAHTAELLDHPNITRVLDAELSGRTDLYSLGVVMFELLAGQPPFSAGSFAQLVKSGENPTDTDAPEIRLS